MPTMPDYAIPPNFVRSMHGISFLKCGACYNFCGVTATCKPKEIITMDYGQMLLGIVTNWNINLQKR
jgi:hypothetical protein